MGEPKPITETQMRLMKPFAQCMSWMNVLLYRWTDGHVGGRFGGGDVCLVKMKGAKSGRIIERPLMYVPYNDGIVLVASFAGAPRHPAWYYNLVANPEIEVTAKGRTRTLVARIASPEEKAEVWPLCVEVYKDFDLYQRRSVRDIPVFVCEPPPGGQ